MKNAFQLSLACLMTATLVNATTLTAKAQDITLSESLLEYCAGVGMNGPSCACFIDAMIEGEELEPKGQLSQEEFLELLEDEDNAAVAATCATKNPD